MKPSWNDAPFWAKYLAMDDDGIWHFHASKPVYTRWTDGINQGFRWISDNLPPEETLEERPDAT